MRFAQSRAQGHPLYGGAGPGARGGQPLIPLGMQGQQGLIRLPQLAQPPAQPGARTANYEVPPDAPALSLGDFVTVDVREVVQPLVGPNWDGHFAAVLGGKKVGCIYRRINDLFFVRFAGDDTGFSFCLTLPYGALKPYDGKPPEDLEAFVKQKPPPPAPPQGAHHAAGRHRPHRQHAHSQHGPAGGGGGGQQPGGPRTRACSVQ